MDNFSELASWVWTNCSNKLYKFINIKVAFYGYFERL